MPTATPHRAIYAASAGLDRLGAAIRAARAALPKSLLPIAAAEANLDDIEDRFATIERQVIDAAAIITAEIERIEAPAIERDLAAWTASIGRPFRVTGSAA